MLPPQRMSPTLRPRKRAGSARTAASPAAPAPSASVFCSGEVGGDRLLDRRLRHQHDVVDEAAGDRQRQLADILDGDAFGERLAADLLGAAAERAPQRRVELGLDADHLGLRRQRLHGNGDAGEEAAAADRNDDDVEIASLSDDLEADRPLAADHLAIVIGVDENRAGLGDQLLHLALRLGEGLALEHDMRAESPGRRDLHEGARPRHDDRRRDAEALGVIGDRLGVIAGRHGDDAARALGRRSATSA